MKLKQVFLPIWVFLKFSGFLSITLPIHDLPFVLMTERGKEWFKSPPFDKRKEVKT